MNRTHPASLSVYRSLTLASASTSASQTPPPPPFAKKGVGGDLMLLEEPDFRTTVTRGAQRPVLGQLGRHVVQLRVDHGHALIRRGQTDRANLEHIVHPQLEK